LCPTRSSPHFKGYCQRCFVYLFPEEKVARNYKVKEQHVVDHIKLFLKDTSYCILFDKTLGGCSSRRPDIFIDCLTHCVIVEIDETQHDSDDYCSCENKRMMELFQDAGNRPIVFIRFNPDGYKNTLGKKIPSCFKKHKNGLVVISDKKTWESRVKTLTDRLAYHTTILSEKEVTIEHLYYNGFH